MCMDMCGHQYVHCFMFFNGCGVYMGEPVQGRYVGVWLCLYSVGMWVCRCECTG